MGRPNQNSAESSVRELLLFFRRLVGRRCLSRWRRSLRCAGHAIFEAANALAKSLHDLGDTFAAKENQNDGQNHKPMKNAKFTHEPPPRARLAARYHNPNAVSLLRQVAATGSTYRITRSSPARRVTRSRSRYSSRGMAYFRVMPVKFLKTGTVMRSPLDFLYADS